MAFACLSPLAPSSPCQIGMVGELASRPQGSSKVPGVRGRFTNRPIPVLVQGNLSSCTYFCSRERDSVEQALSSRVAHVPSTTYTCC
jgi:hypothetical protein